MAYTRGKWNVEIDESGVFVGTPEQMVCKLYKVNPRAWDGDKEITARSNAELIALAPTLFKAFKEAVDRLIDAQDNEAKHFRDIINQIEGAK